MASFVEDEKRGHDDVTGLLRWIGIPPVEQTEIDDSVGFRSTHVQLKEDRNRKRIFTQTLKKQIKAGEIVCKIIGLLHQDV